MRRDETDDDDGADDGDDGDDDYDDNDNDKDDDDDGEDEDGDDDDDDDDGGGGDDNDDNVFITVHRAWQPLYRRQRLLWQLLLLGGDAWGGADVDEILQGQIHGVQSERVVNELITRGSRLVRLVGRQIIIT